jgi:hypothetical protein
MAKYRIVEKLEDGKHVGWGIESQECVSVGWFFPRPTYYWEPVILVGGTPQTFSECEKLIEFWMKPKPVISRVVKKTYG